MRNGVVPQVIRPAQAGNAGNGEHPYLRSVQHRGGGYAILRALWDAEKSPSYEGFLTKDQICRHGQKYCDVPMRDNHFEGRDHGHGWESNKTLVSHRFIERDKAGKSWSTNFRGPKDRISLTQAGRDFVPQMLQKFGDIDDGEADAPAPRMARVVKATKKSPEDLAALQTWADTAPIGAEKEFQVSKDRRKYLHNEIDALNAKGLGYRLLHYSRGDGRQRTLVVKKVTQNEIGMSATPATAMSLDVPLPSRMSFACAAIPGPAGPSGPSGPNGPSGPGHKLGGRPSMDGKREASAMAAERRMSAASVRGVKKPRISRTSQGTPQASQAPQTRTSAVPVVAAPMPEEDECFSSSSDSSGTDEDEEMRKALELSLQDVPSRTNTTPQDEEKDLQEALRLSLESASSQDAPPSPARFPTLLASKSAAPMELDDDSQLAADSSVDDLALTVDLKERCKDASPRDIYEELRKRLEGTVQVQHQQLKMGDYLWTRSAEALGVCIERKTMRDLIGRSAKGDHLRQLRRLSASRLPSALLLEGDISTAPRQVAYGADPIASSHSDTALRESLDVLCLLARLLLERRCFVLLTSNATDTATCLASWSSVIKDMSCCPKVPLDALKKAPESSDRDHSDLLACVHAAGLLKEHQEVIGRRFYSLDELQAAYRRCPDVQKRQLLLAPLLLLPMDADSQGDPSANNRAAASISCELFQAATAQSGGLKLTGPASAPEVQLCLKATTGISKEIASLPQANGCNLEALTKPRCKDVEEVRVQLLGTGEFTSFKSAILHISILNGSQLLRFLLRAWQQVGNMDLPKVATRCAEAIVTSLALQSGEAQKLVLFEGIDVATKQVMGKGQNEQLFPVAKDAAKLFPAVVAVLALRYHTNALPWRNRAKLKEFLIAVFKEFSETQLLDQ